MGNWLICPLCNKKTKIQKACAEYEPADGFPYTFYRKVVSKVILYRDTHIEFKLQNLV